MAGDWDHLALFGDANLAEIVTWQERCVATARDFSQGLPENHPAWANVRAEENTLAQLKAEQERRKAHGAV